MKNPPKRTLPGEKLRWIEEHLNYSGDECLIWPFPSGEKDGYPRIRINKKNILVTRLVCQRINGAPPSLRHEAAHSCGKGHLGCVSPAHLSWKTRIENEADKIRHGTSPCGEKNHFAKLDEASARFIALKCSMVKKRGTKKQLAREFGVSQSAISAIANSESWHHLTAPA
jgi:hypothetical protein